MSKRDHSTSVHGRNYVLHLKVGTKTRCGHAAAMVNCAAGEEPDDALCVTCVRRRGAGAPTAPLLATIPRLSQGQRVVVLRTVDGIALNAVGTIIRIRTDGGAWVRLDQPSQEGERVQVRPEHCKLAETTADERRAARRAAGQTLPTPATWGRDHWSTLAYIETRIVDHGGEPAREHMRCNPKRHPLLAHEASFMGAPSSTRLKDGALLHDHDDWDCVDDMTAAGLLESSGSSLHPVFSLTDTGRTVANALRLHLGAKRVYETFETPGAVQIQKEGEP